MAKTKEKFVTKRYRLTREIAPLSYMLPTRHTNRFPLLWFDEETGVNRELRYGRNQKSVFVDEQDGNVILEPIIFEDGFLTVPHNNQVLQKFLDVHPLNGKRFKEIDKEKDAAQESVNLNLEVDALIAARELSIDQLENITRVVFGLDPSKISTQEMRRDVLVFAKNEPIEFLDIIEDPMLKLQGTVKAFFDTGLLARKGKGAVHYNSKSNKKRMLVVPPGEDELFIVASYLQSEEGIESLKLLEKKLENL